MRKIKDLVVKTGTYNKRDGSEAANWLKVGGLFEGDKGQFILLDRTFNPAGVAGQEGKGTILISLFDEKKKEDTSDNYAQVSGGSTQLDDAINF